MLAPHVVSQNASLLLKLVGFFQEPYFQARQQSVSSCPPGCKGHKELLEQELGSGQGSQWWA